MALSRSMLKTINYVSSFKPAEELNLFNKIVYPDITEDMFITVMNTELDLNLLYLLIQVLVIIL